MLNDKIVKNGCATCDAISKLSVESVHVLGVALGIAIGGTRTPEQAAKRMGELFCADHAQMIVSVAGLLAVFGENAVLATKESPEDAETKTS